MALAPRSSRTAVCARWLPISAVWAALGCSDGGLTKFNAVPTVDITSHKNGDVVQEGVLVRLQGTVGDPDNELTSLTVTWTVDEVAFCEESVTDSFGAVTCEAPIGLDGGQVDLVVRDPSGASDSDRVVLTVEPTEAPEVDLTAPLEDGRYYSDQLVAFGATASDAEDDATALAFAWSSSLQGDLDIVTQVTSGGEASAFGALEEGEHAITVLVSDTTGKTAADSVLIAVGPPNSPPNCAITEPADGALGAYGVEQRFVGLAEDADIPSPDLSVTWESDLDGVLGDSPPESDGTARLSTSALSLGTHVITLSITDEVGAACTDSLYFTVGNAPDLQLDQPSDGDRFNEGEEVAFFGTVSDPEDAPGDLTLTWTSDLDGLLSTAGADSSGGVSLARADLSAGAHTVTVEATDRSGLSDSVSVQITVNALPSAASVDLGPDPAFTDDDLVALAYGSVDPEGGSVTYRYEWYEDGVLSSASTSSTFPASATTKHHSYRVVATPSDGDGDGPSAMAERAVENSPPSLTGPTLSASTAGVGAVITCASSAVDPDPTDVVTVSTAWSDGSTGATLTIPTTATVGDVFTCTVTASDGEAAPISGSASVTVVNSPPVLTTPAISPGTLYTRSTATVSTSATDADGDAISLSYAWSVNGAVVSTSTSLLGTLWFDKGDTVSVQVTATDGIDTTVASSATLTVQNSVPTTPTADVTPSAPAYGDSLLCELDNASSDLDGDTISYHVSWEVDGEPYFAGGSADTADTASPIWTGPTTTTWTDDTVPAEDLLPGEEWTCTLTPNDGTDDGSSATASADPVCFATSSDCPATSCLEVLNLGASTGDGTYWIDGDGTTPVKATCDMTHDGGGWTQIFGVTSTGGLPGVSNTSVNAGLAAATAGSGNIAPSYLYNYQTVSGFSEMRFYCKKVNPGRVIHITTDDPSVIAYFTAQTSTYPTATGSFTVESDDTSYISQVPGSWGTGASSKKWGFPGVATQDRFSQFPMMVWGNYHWATYDIRFECDDYNWATITFAGVWEIWVR